MAGTSRRRSTSVDPRIPRDAREANLCVALIGEAQRERMRLQAELEQAIARIRADYGGRLTRQTRAIARLVRVLRAWCEQYRRESRRAPRFAAGTVAWHRRRAGLGETFVVVPFETKLKEIG